MDPSFSHPRARQTTRPHRPQDNSPLPAPSQRPPTDTPSPSRPHRPVPPSRLPLLLAAALIPLLPHPAAAEDYIGNGSVELTDGSWGSVYGLKSQPRSGEAEADTARVTVSGSTINNALYGGCADSTDGAARAGSNSVSVAGLSGNITFLYGGYARSSTGNADASANSLNMSGTLTLPLDPQLFGGYAYCRNADGGSLLSTNNRISLNLDPGTTLDLVVGGRSRAESSNGTSAAAYGNIISTGSGSISTLYGGWATSGGPAEASANTLNIRGGEITFAVGGEAHSFSDEAVADGNVVAVTGGNVGSIVAASAQSDTARASAGDNAVYLSNTTVAHGVTGGLSTNTNGNAALDRNSVVVGAGAKVLGDVHGGDANQQAEQETGNSSAAHNTIAVVDGGQVDGELIGGNLAASGDASHNSILVNNGLVGGDIIGGRTAAGGSATGNSIIIGRQASLAPTINLLGGEVGGQVVSAQSSGNTLIIDSWQGTVRRAAGFAAIHFVLPSPGSADIGTPMLTVTNAQTGDFTGTTVTAQLPSSIAGGSAYIGETFVLVHDAAGAIAEADVGGLVSLEQGYTTLYDGVIYQDSDSVYIRIDGKRANPLAGALTEARIAAAGLLNQGGDLLAGASLFAADAAARATKGWALFTTAYGGAADLTTDSDITTRGMSGLAGLAHLYSAEKTSILAGAFFEMGFANMSTARSVGARTVSGSGDAHYAGGGLFTRWDVSQGRLRGLYAEAGGRVGEVSTTWAGANLLNDLNIPASYDISTPYGGGHLGLGYQIPLSERWTLDLSSKYLYLHQSGCRTDINGESIRFDSVHSSRLRCGARIVGKALPTTDVYLSAAWEHEFCGEARAYSRSSGITIPTTSMRGSSALMDLGISLTPRTAPVMIDFAIQGAAGTRQSIGARLQLTVDF